jgi:hypothetical protein
VIGQARLVGFPPGAIEAVYLFAAEIQTPSQGELDGAELQMESHIARRVGVVLLLATLLDMIVMKGHRLQGRGRHIFGG